MKNQFLIADDDAIVLRATARMVEHVTGCEAVCCGSGEEALRVFQGDPGAFVAAVTDFDMPGMNGLELGNRLRALAPGIRMVLITGNPGVLERGEAQRCGFDCVLAKPFDLATIGEALHRILPSPGNVPARQPSTNGASFFERPQGILHAFI